MKKNLFGEVVEEVKNNQHKYLPRTKNGYNLDEVISALQKEIRRCNEVRALYWAIELYESGFDKYLWRRLGIIACEEVGLANPNAIQVVNACREAFYFDKKNNSTKQADLHYVSMAILTLVRSPKNREVNDFLAVVLNTKKENDKKGKKLKIPSYALDGHTKKGREIHGNKSKLRTWWEFSRVIKNHGGVNRYFKKIYEMEGKKFNPKWVKDEIKKLEEENKKRNISWFSDEEWGEWST